MKISPLLALVFAACLTAPGGVSAQNGSSLLGGGGPPQGNAQYVIKNINVSTPSTPEYNTQAGDATTKKYTLGKWLEVEVEFAATAPSAEVTIHYNVVITGKLLTGDQTLIDVPAGQSLFTVAFVSPKTLSTLLKGQPLTNASVQNIDVQILRPGVAQPLANKMAKEGPAFYTTMQQITGFVLNKSQTPFAPLWYDRYETVKETSGR